MDTNKIENEIRGVNDKIIVKKQIGIIGQFFIVLIIFIQILLILIMSYLFAKYPNPGNPITGLIQYAGPLFILGIAGFITAISLRNKKIKNSLVLTLLITSIFSIPGVIVPVLISGILRFLFAF